MCLEHASQRISFALALRRCAMCGHGSSIVYIQYGNTLAKIYMQIRLRALQIRNCRASESELWLAEQEGQCAHVTTTTESLFWGEKKNKENYRTQCTEKRKPTGAVDGNICSRSAKHFFFFARSLFASSAFSR